MKKTIIITSILALLLVIGLVILNDMATIGQPYHFQTQTGSFEFIAVPSKGRDIEMMERRILQYDAENNTQITVYRTFKKNYLKFWRWKEYRSSPLYQYEYIRRNTSAN